MNTNDAARLARVSKLEAENTQLREAVRVLGEEARTSADFFRIRRHATSRDGVEELLAACICYEDAVKARDANPIAAAAVKPPTTTGEGVTK